MKGCGKMSSEFWQKDFLKVEELIKEKKLKDAEHLLQTLITHENPHCSLQAQMRLARLHMQEEQFADAIQIFKGMKPSDLKSDDWKLMISGMCSLSDTKTFQEAWLKYSKVLEDGALEDWVSVSCEWLHAATKLKVKPVIEVELDRLEKYYAELPSLDDSFLGMRKIPFHSDFISLAKSAKQVIQ